MIKDKFRFHCSKSHIYIVFLTLFHSYVQLRVLGLVAFYGLLNAKSCIYIYIYIYIIFFSESFVDSIIFKRA